MKCKNKNLESFSFVTFEIDKIYIMIKKICYVILTPLLLFGLYALLCIGYAKIAYFDPPERMNAELTQVIKPSVINDTSFDILIWNIGYCGLGAEADFFYDGGKMMCPTLELETKYLNGVKSVLAANQTDFTMIQEIDRDSRRSYNIDQYDSVFHSSKSKSFAANYDVKYVPLPWTTPMGKVLGGLATVSIFSPSVSERYQLPGAFGFPKQLFFLRRCLLVNKYYLENGKYLEVINIHNSAYDNSGKLKKEEMAYLKTYLESEYAKGNYVVVGGDWNQCPPGFQYDALAIGKEGDYSQTNVDSNFIAGWKWAFDPTKATNRKNDKAYNEATTFTTVIDFFLVSPNVKVNEVKGVETHFEFSDHQPVKMNFGLIK
jgi:endonuclease/exonuclease/phosphatase family metal-dependent hydrolase